MFPIRVPPLLPDVQEATWRYARHGSRGPHPRDHRVPLFRGLWLRGLDLSDPAVLDDLGVDGPAAPDRARQWHTGWREFDDRSLPLLVTSEGDVLHGLRALDELLALRAGPASTVARGRPPRRSSGAQSAPELLQVAGRPDGDAGRGVGCEVDRHAGGLGEQGVADTHTLEEIVEGVDRT